jgi:CheY-like chemotaxis protein
VKDTRFLDRTLVSCCVLESGNLPLPSGKPRLSGSIPVYPVGFEFGYGKTAKNPRFFPNFSPKFRVFSPEAEVTGERLYYNNITRLEVDMGSLLIEQLKNIEGLDTESGLINVGNSEEAYPEVLRAFFSDFDNQIEGLREALASEDWKSYIIQIHGLKGAFLNIGAKDLGKWAYELETASKSGNTEKCKQEINPLCQAMLKLRTALAKTSLMEGADSSVFGLAENDASGEKKTLLAVDDMPASLATIKTILQDQFKLKLCESAQAAMHTLGREKIDIILLDIEMPDISGFDFLKQLRDAPETRSIPVIFVTSYATPGFIEQAIASGVDGYVVKPFVPEVLIKRINDIFNP